MAVREHAPKVANRQRNVKPKMPRIFPIAKRFCDKGLAVPNRQLRADYLLAENIRTLLTRRAVDAGALAVWCGHRPAWISKVLSGERGVQLKDLGKIADFFGLTVAEMFSHGISPLTERRVEARRSQQDRRSGEDRRRPVEERLPDQQPRFHQRAAGGGHGPAPQASRLPRAASTNPPERSRRRVAGGDSR